MTREILRKHFVEKNSSHTVTMARQNFNMVIKIIN